MRRWIGWGRTLIWVGLLGAAGAADATPTTVVVQSTISFSSGDHAASFPVGQPFGLTFTYDPDTPDVDGMPNGGGLFVGSISAMTLELAGLTFAYGGGATAVIITADDQGIPPNLADSAILTPGPYLSGDVLGGFPPSVAVTFQQIMTPNPTIVVGDVLQPSFDFDALTAVFQIISGGMSIETVVSAQAGSAAVPEASPGALLAVACAGLLAVRRSR